MRKRRSRSSIKFEPVFSSLIRSAAEAEGLSLDQFGADAIKFFLGGDLSRRVYADIARIFRDAEPGRLEPRSLVICITMTKALQKASGRSGYLVHDIAKRAVITHAIEVLRGQISTFVVKASFNRQMKRE